MGIGCAGGMGSCTGGMTGGGTGAGGAGRASAILIYIMCS